MDFQLADFLRQVPIGIILVPIALAIIYAVLMVVIVRRARNRRSRLRTIAPADPSQLVADYGNGSLPMAQPAFAPAGSNPVMPTLGTSLAGQATQPHAIPTRVAQISENAIPEPDFDALMPPTSPIPKSRDTHPLTGLLPADSSDQYRAAPEPPITSYAPPVSSAPGAAPNSVSDAVEVMRILRDLSTGKLIIEIGGHPYRSPAEIPNSELARRFQSVVRELNGMLAPAAPAPIRRPSVEGGAAMPDIKLSSQPPTTVESPLSLRRVTGGSNAAPPEALNRGIADQIENYLQYRLANTPEFQHRNIHIRPTVEGGVQIEVDNQVFQAMDMVSDPDVRAFLMTTMREWEARQ